MKVRLWVLVLWSVSRGQAVTSKGPAGDQRPIEGQPGSLT